jgi:hypothetical protein
MKTPFELFQVECGDGWKCLYQPLIDLCNLYGMQVLQVKEKFGGLRFYFHGVGPNGLDIYELVSAAEEASYHICEECGEGGQAGYDSAKGEILYKATTGGSKTSSWIRTLCEPCREKWDKSREEWVKKMTPTKQLEDQDETKDSTVQATIEPKG